LSIAGKRVAQLSCNNGRETLSMLNLGAASAVGFDISDEAINEARELAAVSGLNCEFIRTDVYDIGHEFDRSFELIYISIGALGWLPDLDGFLGIVSRLLKSAGVVVFYEAHPFVEMLACENEKDYDPSNPMKIVYSYFKDDPWIDDTGIDYIGKSTYKSKLCYNFPYKISDLINGLIKNGISISEFTEYPHSIDDVRVLLEKEGKLPLCYILVGRK